ncbi:MAG: DUF4079 family protein [Desulfobulbaceae bacterium]|nr:DUF4079 family protein [Desulfobulbaceae bacterium]
MDYPLISREILAGLRLGHGIYNFAVLGGLCYIARLGWAIRQARKHSTPLPLVAVRRHRRLGPILAPLGGLGFVAGLILVWLDTGNILKYPAHLLVGAAIVSLLLATVLVSRKIRGPNSQPRDTHFRLGIAILGLYLLEVFLGFGVLL